MAAKNKSTDNNQPSFEDLYQQLQNDKNTRVNDTDDKNTVVYDENGVTHVLPWNYNQRLDAYGDNLPPSLKKFKTSDFSKAVITDWG